MFINERKVIRELVLLLIFGVSIFGGSVNNDNSLARDSLNSETKDSSVSSLLLRKKKSDRRVIYDNNSLVEPHEKNNNINPIDINLRNNKGKVSAENSAMRGAEDLKLLATCVSNSPNYVLTNQHKVSLKKQNEDTEDDYTNDNGVYDEAKGGSFRNVYSAGNDADDFSEHTHQYNKRAGKQAKIWDQWGKWSCCNTSCGPGKLIRWRHCVAGGCASGEKEAQLKPCQIRSC